MITNDMNEKEFLNGFVIDLQTGLLGLG